VVIQRGTKVRRRLRGDVPGHLRVVIARAYHQDEFAKQIRTVERDLLRDHSADREPEKIDLRQSETVDECFGVFAMPAAVVALRRS